MIIIQQIPSLPSTVALGPTVLAISPIVAPQGTVVNATVTGIAFHPDTTFSLGTGITVSSLVIVSLIKATMILTISPVATVGFYNLTATDANGTSTLVNAFTVQPSIFQFQTSGLDPNDMAILGTTGTQTLYWDYSNTQDFYIQIAAGQFGLTRATLFAVSPLFANNWFGNQAPSVVYDPFSFNPSKPSNL